MIIRRFFAFLIVMLNFVAISANPPKPDAGKRWVLNPDYSDEFNGTELDDTKWFDYHPTWKGREPGIFVPEMVKVQGGYLKLSSKQMANDTIITSPWSDKQYTYNIKCAAVVSKKQEAHYGYYESRFKAAKSTMSATFWFSNRKNFTGPEGCDSYSQEWDIQECIGAEGGFDGDFFAKGMHSNAHFWYNDCDKVHHDYRADEVRYEDTKLASEQFDTYGGWWHDGTRASYYYNNTDVKEQAFYTGVIAEPMSKPMGMNLVHETYPFPWIALPTARQLADTAHNYCLYDWVRAYVQVDVDEPSPYSDAPQLNLYDENVEFESNRIVADVSTGLSVPFTFQCNEDRYITLEIKDNNNAIIADTTLHAYQGFANYLLNFEFSSIPANGSYTIVASLKDGTSSTSTVLKSARAGLVLSGGAAMTTVSKLRLNITPNPVKDIIRLDGANALIDFVIYNLSGQEVKKGLLTDNTISVKGLNQGYYIFKSDKYRARFIKT